MIRQRFSSGRLARIGAWALAAVTSVAAILNSQMAAADKTGPSVGSDGPTVDQFAPVTAGVPALPAGGLLILRYEPTAPPPPPTIVRRVIVEERVAGASGSTTAANRSATPSPAAAGPTAPASSSAPTPPPPAPAPLPPAPPVQSSGS